MKISSFKLSDQAAGKLHAAFEALNNTYTDYPDNKTVNELFEEIAKEAKEDPDLLHEAPHNAPFGRLDEVKAAKELVLKTQLPDGYGK